MRTALFLLCALSTPLFAQERVSVGPLVGFYFASSEFVAPGPVLSSSALYKQHIAPALGVQATYWATSRFGLGASLAWSSSDVVPPGSAADSSIPSSVRMAAAFMALRIGSLERDLAVHLRLGIAQVAHLGEAFEPFEGTAPLGVVTGFESTLPIGRNLRGEAGFDLYLYALQLTEGAFTYEKRRMVDAVARVGLSWGFGER